MSNQEIKNQGQTKEEAAVEKRRRFIKGAGVAAPVVLTLSSPSVLGIQCGSEVASGGSQTSVTGSCQPGQNPAYWSSPLHKGEWTAPYAYGELPDPPPASPICSDYIGGTIFDTVFPTAGLTGADTRTMREILCSVDVADRLKKDLVAALLNGAIIPNTYPLNDLDVKAIQAGTLGALPTKPGQTFTADDVTAYIETTW